MAVSVDTADPCSILWHIPSQPADAYLPTYLPSWDGKLGTTICTAAGKSIGFCNDVHAGFGKHCAGSHLIMLLRLILRFLVLSSFY